MIDLDESEHLDGATRTLICLKRIEIVSDLRFRRDLLDLLEQWVLNSAFDDRELAITSLQ